MDYAGHTVAVVSQHTGVLRKVQIFVAVLGASNYTYDETTWTQGLQEWIWSHQRTFTFLGGVPDNLRSGVSKAHRYEPDINPTYLEFAIHYGVAIITVCVQRPKDKANVRRQLT